MKKKKTFDVLTLLTSFQDKIIKNKPPFEKMLDEIRMMKFRIRPLGGDLTRINFGDQQLIETLWNLGKIDDFFQNEYGGLTAQQKKIFFKFIDNIYRKFQNELNRIKFKNDQPQDMQAMVEMEIFKEKSLRIN